MSRNEFGIGKIRKVSSIIAQLCMSRVICMDDVTGGYNWFYFKNHGEKMLEKAKKKNRKYALLDVQYTKYRNYSTCYGGDEGERLLSNINRLIAEYIEHDELCAHYSKANFCVLMRFDGERKLRKRVEKLADILESGGEHQKLKFHIGVSIATDKEIPQKHEHGKWSTRIEHFYNHACIARASIQEQEDRRVALFDSRLLEQHLWNNKVEEMMENSLKNNEFKIYLQAKYSPSGEKLMGAEALVRWINKENGIITPDRFIPIFEQNGFITKLDDYMISGVAGLIADWISMGKEVVTISVNVSRAHFIDPNLAKHICGIVDRYHIPHSTIEFELTESAFFDDKHRIVETVKELQRNGFSVSMDDFGSGYSSLNSLKNLPLNVLKLDAEFFHGDDNEKRGKIIVAEAIDLAKKLNMKVVAEGIEKEEQVKFLAKQECDMIQGYFFAKPEPVKEFENKHLEKIQKR